MKLHVEIMKKDGKQFAVFPYEEFVEMERILDDAQDLIDLREAKTAEADAPTIGMDELKRRLGM